MLNVSLKVLGGKHNGEIVPITTPKFLIGREDDCHLRPNSDMVSRHHCAFTVDDFGVRLRDLGSTNGTLVNGERIRGVAQLNEGDEIAIGKLNFQLLIGDTATAAATGPKLDLNSETAELSGAETRLDIPAANEQTATAATGDTQQFQVPPTDETEALPAEQEATVAEPALAEATQSAPAAPPAQQQQPMPQQPMPQYGGYPPAQYPQQPGYYPAPPQMGYPPQMGGYYPPQYPQYPYPQQQVVMGQPMPGYAPPQGQPEQPAETPSSSDSSSDLPATRLPDPSQTGAKAPEAPPQAAGGDAPPPSTERNPSDHAADIIKSHLQRRPSTDG